MTNTLWTLAEYWQNGYAAWYGIEILRVAILDSSNNPLSEYEIVFFLMSGTKLFWCEPGSNTAIDQWTERPIAGSDMCVCILVLSMWRQRLWPQCSTENCVKFTLASRAYQKRSHCCILSAARGRVSWSSSVLTNVFVDVQRRTTRKLGTALLAHILFNLRLMHPTEWCTTACS